MENSKQVQKAGDGSQQIQAESVVVNNGYSAGDVGDIFKALIPMAIQDYTQEAYRIAEERIERLENKLLPRIIEIENAISIFADPAFQVQLKNAQRTAAISESEEDYELLTELMVAHIEKGFDRKNRTGIQKAVEIVGLIDNDALCALTIAHAVRYFLPAKSTVKEGLEVLNSLFSKLLYDELPNGMDWLDHLDILGAVRMNQFGNMKNFSDYYTEQLNGYVCVGIEKDTEDYDKAIKLLSSVHLDVNMLISNPFLENFVCIPIYNKDGIEDLYLSNNIERRKINKIEIDILSEIWNMYNQDKQLINEVKKKFIEMWDTYEALRKVRMWWEKIPRSFSITSVGRVLAHTNAKRCDKDVPDLI